MLGNYSDTLDVLNVNALGSGTITLNAGGVLLAQPANVAPYKNNTYNFTDNMVFNGGTFNGQDGLQHLGTGGALDHNQRCVQRFDHQHDRGELGQQVCLS